MNHLIDYLSHSLQYAPSLSPSRFFPVLSQSVVWHYVDGRGQKSKVLSDGPEQMIIAVSCWCMFNQRQIRKCAVAQTYTQAHSYECPVVDVWQIHGINDPADNEIFNEIIRFFVRSVHDERHLRKPLCERRCRLSTNASLHFIDRWLTPEHTVAHRNYRMCCDAAKQYALTIQSINKIDCSTRRQILERKYYFSKFTRMIIIHRRSKSLEHVSNEDE